MNTNSIIDLMKTCGVPPHQGSTPHAISMFTLIVGDDNWRRLVDDIVENPPPGKNTEILVELLAFIQPEAALDQMWTHVNTQTAENNWLLQKLIPQCTSVKNIHISIHYAKNNYTNNEAQQCIVDSVKQMLTQYTADKEEIQHIVSLSNLPPKTLEAIQGILD